MFNSLVYGVFETPRKARPLMRRLRRDGIRGRVLRVDETTHAFPGRELPLFATEYWRGGLVGAVAAGVFAMLIGGATAELTSNAHPFEHVGVLAALGLMGAAFGAIAGLLSFSATRKHAIEALEDDVDGGVVVLAEAGPLSVDRVEAEFNEHGAQMVGTA